MRPLLIVSDSHGLKDELFELFLKYKDYYIIHLGDYCINDSLLEKRNICFVRGNCDLSFAPVERLLNIDGNIIFMTHGHKYNVKSQMNSLYYKALENKANYCLYGHTHIEALFSSEGITFINPGSFKSNRSYCVIENGEVIFKRM